MGNCVAKTLRAKGTLISEPRFLPPARCDFSQAREGKWPSQRGFFFEKAIFLSAPNLRRFLRFAICDAHRGPQKSQRFPREEKAMLHCDLRVQWKVASDLRFRAAISEPQTPSFCGISGDLAPSTRKSLAITIVRFWCAKPFSLSRVGKIASRRG